MGKGSGGVRRGIRGGVDKHGMGGTAEGTGIMIGGSSERG